MSGATLPKSRRAKRCRAGGAKPNAGCDTDDCHTIKGADIGFRRTYGFHPRRAKRRAQVCGDSTVQNDGRRAGSPHPPQAVPLPLRGEGLNAAQDGRDFPCRTRHSACPASEALPACRRMLPVANAGGAKPVAGRGGLEGFTPPHHYRRGHRLPADSVHSPAPREAPGSGLR